MLVYRSVKKCLECSLLFTWHLFSISDESGMVQKTPMWPNKTALQKLWAQILGTFKSDSWRPIFETNAQRIGSFKLKRLSTLRIYSKQKKQEWMTRFFFARFFWIFSPHQWLEITWFLGLLSLTNRRSEPLQVEINTWHWKLRALTFHRFSSSSLLNEPLVVHNFEMHPNLHYSL